MRVIAIDRQRLINYSKIYAPYNGGDSSNNVRMETRITFFFSQIEHIVFYVSFLNTVLWFYCCVQFSIQFKWAFFQCAVYSLIIRKYNGNIKTSYHCVGLTLNHLYLSVVRFHLYNIVIVDVNDFVINYHHFI